MLRLNRQDGGVECVETESADWIRHPAGDDVAAWPLDRHGVVGLRFQAISVSMFLTSELVEHEDIGIGDDIFMVGRFIGHDGKQRNIPSVRFGNISMMPIEPIVSAWGIRQESFLVEVRSLPGYSGSPVFLYSSSPMNDMSVRRLGTPMFVEATESSKSPLPRIFENGPGSLFDKAMKQMNAKGPYLLGIDWCHLNDAKRENAGMAGVIPSWRIADVINSEEVVIQRRESEQKWLESSSSPDQKQLSEL